MSELSNLGNQQAAADSLASIMMENWLKGQMSPRDEKGEQQPGGLQAVGAGAKSAAGLSSPPAGAGNFGQTVAAAASAAGIPPESMNGGIRQASRGGDIMAVTDKPDQAIGLMGISQNEWRNEILPSLNDRERQTIMALTGKPGAQLNMNNPLHNLIAGAFKIAQQVKASGGDPAAAIEGMAQGFGAAGGAGGIAGNDTMGAALAALAELERRQALKPQPKPRPPASGGGGGSGDRVNGGGHGGDSGSHVGGTAGGGQAASVDRAARPHNSGTTVSEGTPTPTGTGGVTPGGNVTHAPTPKGQNALPLEPRLLEGNSQAWNLDRKPTMAENASIENGVLTVQYPAGSSTPSRTHSGGLLFDARPPGFPAESATLSYRFKPSENFDWFRGGKLGGGLKIGEGDASGKRFSDTAASARVTWGEDGQLFAYVYRMNGTQQDPSYRDMIVKNGNGASGDHLFSGLFAKSNDWNDVSISVKLNSVVNGVPQADGSLTLSVNGESRSFDNMVWRDDPDTKVENIMFSTFVGGNWYNPVNSSVQFTDFSYSANG